ncbi:hypothetical protein [uncultured Desulfobacter sp.]|uniref:hypothetical protein n=1 Tax=uncultured Desulfobacter sp. TaxID=240139 RepID=UPI0029F5973B|nr:hypothetical protein [uncultured Desulfobacter sp.]
MAEINDGFCDDTSTISIFEVLMIIRHRILVVFIVGIIIFTGFLGYCLVTPSVYRVSIFVEKKFDFQDNALKEVGLTNLAIPIGMLQKLPSKQQAEKLGVESFLMDDIKAIAASVKEKNVLKIDVLALNTASGEKLIKAFEVYINNLPVVKQQVIFYKDLLKQKYGRLSKLLNNPGEQFKSSDKIVLSEVYSSLYLMEKEYIELKSILSELEKGLFYFSDIYKSDIPVQPRKIVLLAVGAFISGISGILFAFIMEWFSLTKKKYGVGKFSGKDQG